MIFRSRTYVERLQFEPPSTSAAYPDHSTIPGVPKRAALMESDAEKSGDGEILAFVVAANLNEILAAVQASKKQLSSVVRHYATMLHTEHGKNLQETLDVGRAIGVTPVLTAAVDALLVKGARELARLVPLSGEQFGESYVAVMIKSHQEVLRKIDHQFLEEADNEAVKQHLKKTRSHVAAHLDEAMAIQRGQAG